jgi:putrescine aminotransferase
MKNRSFLLLFFFMYKEFVAIKENILKSICILEVDVLDDCMKEAIIGNTMQKYEEFINPAIARLFRFMGLATIEWEAEGVIIKDINGKEYIDCLGGYGVFSCGHRHPKIVQAVKDQLDKMPLSSKILLNKQMADLAELLADITPGDLSYSFFCNSGTEAVEGALKLAKIHTRKQKIIATKNAFHGKSLGALSATGRDLFREPFQPLLTGFSHVPFGDIEALDAMIDDDTAAVIIEPLQGEGGIIVPPPGYLAQVRQLCDQTGTLLIVDEVQTGLGRTGAMFAVDHYDVVPDIMTLAKALGGGVMPIGAFIARPHLWEQYVTSPFLHTSTFGGNPLACAAGIATIQVIQEEALVEKAAVQGHYFLEKLTELATAYPAVIREVRGKGLFIGLELTKEGVGGLLMAELIDNGILVAYTLNNPKVIRIEPPLIISREMIDKVLRVIETTVCKANTMIEDL